MDLELEILLFIEFEQKKNGNKCGTSVASLINEFNIQYNDLKVILNNLRESKKIIARKGLNQVLIFLPKTK